MTTPTRSKDVARPVRRRTTGRGGSPAASSKGGSSAAPAVEHPRSVATLPPAVEPDAMPDHPFAEGLEDQLDPDLRHRLISERAYRRYEQRGSEDGFDLEDWLEAEAEVDHQGGQGTSRRGSE